MFPALPIIHGNPTVTVGVIVETAWPSERERESCLFKRETEHLWLRQLMHGVGRDPFARA